MNDLRWPAKLYITGLVLMALVTTLGALVVGPHSIPMPAALLIVAFMTAAWLFPLPFTFKTKLYLDTSVMVTAVLLLEPGLAILLTGVGTFAAHLVRRKPSDEILFNTSQVMLQVATGSFLLAGAGWSLAHPSFNRPVLLCAIVGVSVAMYLVNQLAVAVIVGLQAHLSPVRVWSDALAHTDRTEYLTHLAQMGLGMFAAISATGAPWSLSLLVLPSVAVYSALQRNIELRQRAEGALQDREVSLAEAQRVAQLGSWDWNLTTGEQSWSDEAFRLFGYAAQAFMPTFDRFLNCVHPEDRATLDQAVHAALYAGQPFSTEHRIRRPDGSERIVHQQGEVLFDAEGRKARMAGTIHDITRRKALETQLAYQAYHDSLTELPNRARFMQRLDDALARPTRSRPLWAVLFLDLDRFKLINDTMGHEAGDHVLIEVAKRLQRCVRPGDTVARLGGDEFTVLLANLAGPGEAERIASRIVDALSRPVMLDSLELFITTSVGIVLPGSQHHCAAELLRDADVAMYDAKDGGHGRYAVFDTNMGHAVEARVNLEADLRRAIQRGELRLHYQPIVELDTGRIAGMEALVRWQHPGRGLLMPGDFIPLAEDTGLIRPVGWWVLTEACQQMRQWNAQCAGAISMTINVNLSARQLTEGDFVERIERIMQATDLASQQLVLEITESTIMEQPTAASTLTQLRARGIRLALDDFGTGYSSLGVLHRFPIDLVKIDRTFLTGLDADDSRAAIIRAILTMADTLGMAVVAEGVETLTQRTQLLAVGVRQVQGYLFSRPLDPESASVLIASPPWQREHALRLVSALPRSA